MPPRRNIILSIATRLAVAFALLIVASGIYFALYQTREVPSRYEGEEILPQVLVIEARPVPVARQWEGFGTARARFAAGVPAQVRGLVVEVPEEIVAGASVQQGQLLAQLDDTDFRDEIDTIEQRMGEIDAQLAQLAVEEQRTGEQIELLREEVELAQAELDRALSAQQRQGALQREVDLARTALTAASRAMLTAQEQLDRIAPRRSQFQATRAQQESALRTAMRNLDRTRIVSPMAGMLQSVDVEAGETVQIDQQVARVVRLDRVEVPLRLPASARSDLAVGSEVSLFSTGPRAQQWIAQIARIAPEDDERTRTVTVYVELWQLPTDEIDDAGSPLLAPGQFVRGIATAPRAQMRLVVPRRSIQGDRVRLIDEQGVVDSRRVTVDFHVQQEFRELGLPDSQWLVLAEPAGIHPGTLVIVNAGRTLGEGSRAEPVPAELPQHAYQAGSADER